MAKGDDFEYYYYDPSLPAAIIFVVFFLVLTLLHLFRLIRSRAWYFIPFLVGGFCKPQLETQVLHSC